MIIERPAVPINLEIGTYARLSLSSRGDLVGNCTMDRSGKIATVRCK